MADLDLVIDRRQFARRQSVPAQRRLYQALRAAILDGRLQAGALLPASRVLAQDLGGDLGYTVVIDHGAGVKSLFFNLREVSVEKGDELKQGQVIAECGRTTVAEMRIGMAPIVMISAFW